MPELQSVYALRTREIPITDDDGVVAFTVRVSADKLTRAVFQEIETARKASDGFLLASKAIVPLITWDLTVDGEPYPVTEENVIGLGLPIVLALDKAVNEAVAFLLPTIRPNSEVSADGSSTAT